MTTALTDPLLLTAKQVAEVLQVPLETVRNLHRTKQLTARRIGKHNRYRPADVRRFVEGLDNVENQ